MEKLRRYREFPHFCCLHTYRASPIINRVYHPSDKLPERTLATPCLCVQSPPRILFWPFRFVGWLSILQRTGHSLQDHTAVIHVVIIISLCCGEGTEMVASSATTQLFL